MKALQVISTLLLIGVLASVTNAQSEGKFLGTAVVRHNPYVRNSSNVLCYGAFLKSWLVLTTASCIKGKKANDLAVDMSFKVGKEVFSNYPVLVREFAFHPNFTKDARHFDFAFLVLNTVYDWNVEPFFIPNSGFSSETPGKDQTETFFDFFSNKNTIVPMFFREKSVITADFSACKEEKDKKYFFCATPTATKTFKPEYKGAPLFFIDKQQGNQKRLFGLYTGLHANEAVKAHLFLKVYESVTWMHDFMKKFTKPPLMP